MKKVLVLKHGNFARLGLLGVALDDADIKVDEVNFSIDPKAQPSLEGYDGLIILGGLMSAFQTLRYPHLRHEMALVEYCMTRQLPLLGICLGAQIGAQALGATVAANREAEIGWYPVTLTQAGRQCPLFSHWGETEMVFQWHGDAFTLPKGCVNLASSVLCPNQIVQYGTLAFGLQCHLEATAELIRQWIEVPWHKTELANMPRPVSPADILADTHKYLARSQALALGVFNKFVALI